jgi:hypothetical protein
MLLLLLLPLPALLLARVPVRFLVLPRLRLLALRRVVAPPAEARLTVRVRVRVLVLVLAPVLVPALLFVAVAISIGSPQHDISRSVQSQLCISPLLFLQGLVTWTSKPQQPHENLSPFLTSWQEAIMCSFPMAPRAPAGSAIRHGGRSR